MDAASFDFNSEQAKVKPAFAGFLVDWSLGSREITSTLVDLTVREYLFVSGDSLVKTPKLKSSTIRPFEQKLVARIFGDKESLTFDELKKTAYKDAYDGLIRIIVDGAYEEGILDPGFTKKLAGEVKDSMKSFLPDKIFDGIPPDKITTVHKPLPSWVFAFACVAAIVIYIILLIASIFVGNPSVKAVLDTLLTAHSFIILAPVLMMSLVIILTNTLVRNKIGSDTSDFALTREGKRQKSLSLSLMNFMKTYPLLEDRLANELVSHSIAFGIGRNWMHKFGGKNADLTLLFESIQTAADTTAKVINPDEYMRELWLKQT